MANGIRIGDPGGFNKGRSSKFREDSGVRQTPEEGQRTYRPKHCRNNNKDEDNSPKTLHDKNLQASSQKFRQLISKSLSPFSFFTLSSAGTTKSTVQHVLFFVSNYLVLVCTYTIWQGSNLNVLHNSQ